MKTNMLKKILLGLAVAFVFLLALISMQPATFHVERSIEMSAATDVVFAQVNDFHAWHAWSPWEKLDPGMTRSHDGAASGVGARYSWAGNSQVGEGRMTIEKSEPGRIQIKLEFLKPFAATNVATFTFAKTTGGTRVTWAMDGKNNFIAKAFHLVMNMDKMIGPDFDRGLAAMKAVAETAPHPSGTSMAP